MSNAKVIVVGGGLSGLSAWYVSISSSLHPGHAALSFIDAIHG